MSSLHPTPAVCGFPTEEARLLIAETGICMCHSYCCIWIELLLHSLILIKRTQNHTLCFLQFVILNYPLTVLLITRKLTIYLATHAVTNQFWVVYNWLCVIKVCLVLIKRPVSSGTHSKYVVQKYLIEGCMLGLLVGLEEEKVSLLLVLDQLW